MERDRRATIRTAVWLALVLALGWLWWLGQARIRLLPPERAPVVHDLQRERLVGDVYYGHLGLRRLAPTLQTLD